MSALRPLEEKLQEFYGASRTCDQVFKHAQIQAQQTERQIKDEFEKLRQFLQEEEEARIAALREEEQQKSQMMSEKIEKINGEISSLSDTIKTMKDKLDANSRVFLQDYGDTMKRAWGTPESPEKVPGALIDVAKHLSNLKYRVWKKMLGTVQCTPFILDPNTAGPSLVVSDDLTQGVHGDEEGRGKLPDNPERFTPYACVLGSRALGPGRHRWEVEVGDSRNWTLGVASEAVRRKEEYSACPEEGVWAISLRDGEYRAMGSPCSLIPVRGTPRNIRVELDWEGGELTFSDAADGTPLYTFTHPFTGRVYPYFESVCGRRALRILPERVTVSVDECPIGQDHATMPSTTEARRVF